MHALKIDLDALGAAFDNAGSSISYLDLDSGDILVRLPDEPAPGESDKYNIEPERYLRIDPLTAAQQLALREAFLASVDDLSAHVVLSQALAGRKALRSFHYALEQFPPARVAWARYQARVLVEHALEWLQENGLEAGSPPQPPRAPLRSPGERSPVRR